MTFLGIEQLSDEPIFILDFEGDITLEDFMTAYAACLLRWDESYRATGTYVLIDMRKATTSDFGTVIDSARMNAMQDAAIADIVSHVSQFLVGEHPLTKLYANMRQQTQFGGVPMPVFRTLDDAITAARTAIKQRLSASAVDSSQS